MSRVEYELLREDRPELRLMLWNALLEQDLQRVREHTQQSLVAQFAAILLTEENHPGWIWTEVP